MARRLSQASSRRPAGEGESRVLLCPFCPSCPAVHFSQHSATHNNAISHTFFPKPANQSSSGGFSSTTGAAGGGGGIFSTTAPFLDFLSLPFFPVSAQPLPPKKSSSAGAGAAGGGGGISGVGSGSRLPQSKVPFVLAAAFLSCQSTVSTTIVAVSLTRPLSHLLRRRHAP